VFCGRLGGRLPGKELDEVEGDRGSVWIHGLEVDGMGAGGGAHRLAGGRGGRGWTLSSPTGLLGAAAPAHGCSHEQDQQCGAAPANTLGGTRCCSKRGGGGC